MTHKYKVGQTVQFKDSVYEIEGTAKITEIDGERGYKYKADVIELTEDPNEYRSSQVCLEDPEIVRVVLKRVRKPKVTSPTPKFKVGDVVDFLDSTESKGLAGCGEVTSSTHGVEGVTYDIKVTEVTSSRENEHFRIGSRYTAYEREIVGLHVEAPAVEFKVGQRVSFELGDNKYTGSVHFLESNNPNALIQLDGRGLGWKGGDVFGTKSWLHYWWMDKSELQLLTVAPAPLDEAAARKATPLFTGCIAYFPDALAEVARVSLAGNKQHHADKPLHWEKNKSTDHADAGMRHMVDHGTRDTDGQRHSGKAAWRALALLQTELEAEDPELAARRQAQRDAAARG